MGSRSLKDRLLDRTLITDACWLWQGSTNVWGYGKIKLAGKTLSTHRASYGVFVGEVPENTNVLHRCDVRNCIRPDHLFIGTTQDNVRDKVAKERQPRGVTHGCHVLSESEVAEIRRLRKQGKLLREIADIFGISKSLVSQIANLQVWTHLERE